jgi:hypothetical protein
VEAKALRVDTQLWGRRPGCARQALQAQHFLASAWSERNPIGARGGLQRPQRPIGVRFSEVGPLWFFDESAQARQYTIRMVRVEPDPPHLYRRAPWPKEPDRSFVGYSIGQWIDTNNSGIYDTLEVETRSFEGPRLMDNSGIPLHEDGETVVKEKIYLDKANPDIMHNEITTIDHAFTRPWVVSRFYKRVHNGRPQEYNCGEDNRWVVIGGWTYLADTEGYLMPIQKDEPPPDPRLFQKYFPKK